MPRGGSFVCGLKSQVTSICPEILALFNVGIGVCAIIVFVGEDEPSITTVPTATCPTDSQQEYFNALTGEMDRIGALTTMIGEDLSRAGGNPSLLLDDVWVMGITNNTYVIDRATDAIWGLPSPVSAEVVREPAHEMAQRIKSAMPAVEYGVEDLDLEELEMGVAIMSDVATDSRHIRGLIASFCQLN